MTAMTTQPVLFRAGWRYLKTFGGGRWYLFPWDVAIRDDGMMAVIVRYETAEHANNTLNPFDDELIGQFGSYGQGDEQFTWPTSRRHHHADVDDPTGLSDLLG